MLFYPSISNNYCPIAKSLNKMFSKSTLSQVHPSLGHTLIACLSWKYPRKGLSKILYRGKLPPRHPNQPTKIDDWWLRGGGGEGGSCRPSIWSLSPPPLAPLGPPSCPPSFQCSSHVRDRQTVKLLPEVKVTASPGISSWSMPHVLPTGFLKRIVT